MRYIDIETLPQVSQLKLDLIAARMLIADEEHWCKGALRDGSRFCSAGALYEIISLGGSKINHQRYRDAYNALIAARPFSSTMAMSVEMYNDCSTHAQVMAWWDKAIAAAS